MKEDGEGFTELNFSIKNKKEEKRVKLQQEVDHILDKINKVGYEALSKDEKNTLYASSRKLYQTREKDNSKNKITPLIVETNDIDVTFNEAVMKGDKSIGYVTSGGFAHFVNKSVAFSYLDTKQLNSDKKIQVEINGDMFNCSIIKDPLYDPSGQKMRS